MSRTLSLLILTLIAIGIYLIGRHVYDSYNTSFPQQIPTNTPSSTEVIPQPMVSHFETWREFTAPSGDFRVLLPNLPQHATDKIMDPQTKEPHKYDMYVAAKDDGTVFMISAISFPTVADEKTNERLLTNVVNDMLARNADNKLKMMRAGKFHDFQTMDFAIENEDVVLGGKAFVHGKTLYVLSMVSKQGTLNAKDFDFFVNSFDVVSKPMEPATKTPQEVEIPTKVETPTKTESPSERTSPRTSPTPEKPSNRKNE